jgi:hypothetical protein
VAVGAAAELAVVGGDCGGGCSAQPDTVSTNTVATANAVTRVLIGATVCALTLPQDAYWR